MNFYQMSVSGAACKKAQVSRVLAYCLTDPGEAFFSFLSLVLGIPFT